MAGLKALIKKHDLMLNNWPGKATKPTRWTTTSIIKLTWTTQDISAPDSWIIDVELSIPSDHVVIECDYTNLNETVRGIGNSQEVTG